MGQKFSNNASATLAASISSTSVSLTVTTGQGALFPALAAGDYFYATLVDSSNNIEYVKITARSGDTLTAVRGQDGSTARAYAAADRLALRPIAATLNDMQTATSALVQAAVQALYPIGSIYTSTVSTNPGTLFGFGTWVAYGAGRVLVGQDGGTFTPGSTGGSADAITVAHTHTVTATGTSSGQSNTHSHSVTVASGGSHTHTYKTYGLGNSGLVGNAYTNSDWGWATTGNPAGTAEGTHSHSASAGNADADHTHSLSVSGSTASTGAAGTNANLQPYVVVYMWNRTA